ncbi:MAG: hypothetical protein IPG21_16335 [Saprospiraceae bacterium]|nr:hypothetical protein [Candidatus Vicinibacter affinis]
MLFFAVHFDCIFNVSEYSLTKVIELYSRLQVFFEKTLNMIENHLVRWEIGSFGVWLCVGFCEGQTPNVPMGWLKLFLKCAVGKF